MKLQSLKKVLLTGTVLALLAATACQSSETKSYARQLNLPKEVSTAVSQLEYDAITRSLLHELSYLPKDLQTHEVTLNYLKEISEDKTVSYDEVSGIRKLDHDGDGLNLEEENELKTDPLQPNPGIKKVVDYLESVSDETLDMYKRLGIDGDVVPYINLVSTLPKDFADYAVKSKLCIQDKKLTEEEEKFLHDPNKYLQEMYESNISWIATIDPELAIKLKQIPFLQDGIELKDVESLEDILYLASNPQNQSKLERIYGKGIERKMWPVALEKLIWDSYNNELDASDLGIHLRLADFQAKYNKDMDMEGVTGPKPAIRGINYIDEPQEWITTKNEDDFKYDYALMRWVLRCNAVRLYGSNDYVFHHVKLAQDEGLKIYLQVEQTVKYPNMNFDSYKEGLIGLSKKAKEHKIEFLSVGYELELWWKMFGSEGAWGWNPASFESRKMSNVQKFLDESVRITRQHYDGVITYADWWASKWGLSELNWSLMDMVCINMHIEKFNENYFLNYILEMKKKNYPKPFVVSETGSQTITEAEEAGGDDSYIWRFPVHENQEKQAQMMDKVLRLIYQAKADGVYVYAFDRTEWRNMNTLGLGIWNYVKKEPKLSFWTVYKYFKE